MSAVATAPDSPYFFPRVVPVTSCAFPDPLISILVSVFDKCFEISRVEWRTKYSQYRLQGHVVYSHTHNKSTVMSVSCIDRALLGFLIIIVIIIVLELM